VDLDAVQTNIVYFTIDDPGDIVDDCLERGVAMLTLGANIIRAVFHLDVTRDDTMEATATVARVVSNR
jgi:4-aminobutyrate aminotransferase-like enzyme